MEKMLNEFKEEYACQYSLYLDSADAVDSLLEQKDCDKQEMAEAMVRWKRARSVMRELRRVAKISDILKKILNAGNGLNTKNVTRKAEG